MLRNIFLTRTVLFFKVVIFQLFFENKKCLIEFMYINYCVILVFIL